MITTTLSPHCIYASSTHFVCSECATDTMELTEVTEAMLLEWVNQDHTPLQCRCGRLEGAITHTGHLAIREAAGEDIKEFLEDITLTDVLELTRLALDGPSYRIHGITLTPTANPQHSEQPVLTVTLTDRTGRTRIADITLHGTWRTSPHLDQPRCQCDHPDHQRPARSHPYLGVPASPNQIPGSCYCTDCATTHAHSQS